MLFWTKLLTAAHAATTSVHPYLYLYYTHMLKFDVFTISMLSACVMVLNVPASAFWVDLVDHRPSLHGVFTGLLTAVGTAGILLILSVPPTWAAAALPVAVLSSIFDGLFYQPLEVLVDSAIIKILGDYKILYARERQYGKFVSILLTLGIGWSLDDDHDFDTLMVLILIGSVILFLLSLSTTVQAADPSLLDVPTNEALDETAPLTKHALQPTETSSSYVYYKPYSLFGEQLSHISEEDASMLQRIATTNNSVSTKPQPRPISVYSTSSALSNTTTAPNNHHIPSTTAIEYEDSACFFSSSPLLPPSPFSLATPRAHYPSSIQQHIPIFLDNPENSPPSFELARLPYPPPSAPIIVLITLKPNYYKAHPTSYQNTCLPAEEEYYHRCSIAAHHHQQQSKWILKSFLSSLFCLGIVFGMTQPLLYLYLHDTLGVPMHSIGIIGSMFLIADLLATRLVISAIHHFQLLLIIASAHILVFLCVLGYTWLQPGHVMTQFIVMLLQLLLGTLFHIVWLSAAHQVDSVVLSGYKRIMVKGGMAALYNSIGPAIGVLTAGYIISGQTEALEGYRIVYQYAAGLTVISGILSWEWSTTD